MRCHLGRVVLVAEHGRKDLMFIGTARADLTSCQTVADLREDQCREYRYDREAHLIVALWPKGHETWLLKLQVIASDADIGVGGMGDVVHVAVRIGPRDVVPVA